MEDEAPKSRPTWNDPILDPVPTKPLGGRRRGTPPAAVSGGRRRVLAVAEDGPRPTGEAVTSGRRRGPVVRDDDHFPSPAPVTVDSVGALDGVPRAVGPEGSGRPNPTPPRPRPHQPADSRIVVIEDDAPSNPFSDSRVVVVDDDHPSNPFAAQPRSHSTVPPPPPPPPPVVQATFNPRSSTIFRPTGRGRGKGPNGSAAKVPARQPPVQPPRPPGARADSRPVRGPATHDSWVADEYIDGPAQPQPPRSAQPPTFRSSGAGPVKADSWVAEEYVDKPPDWRPPPQGAPARSGPTQKHRRDGARRMASGLDLYLGRDPRRR
jgi:hypothetical protein